MAEAPVAAASAGPAAGAPPAAAGPVAGARPAEASPAAGAWLAPATGALLAFGAWAVVPRALGPDSSSVDVQLAAAVGLVPILALLARGTTFRGPARRGSALAAGAGTLTAVGNLLYYAALARGGAASVLAPLTALYPVVTVVLSVPLLRERLAWAQAAGLALALVAMGLFAVEGPLDFGPGAVLPVLCIVAWGLSAIGQKMSVRTVSPRQSSFLYLSASLPVSVALWALGGGGAGSSGRDLGIGALLGLLLGVGNVCLAQAYGRAGKASVVTTFSALYWVIAVPVGVLVFGERLDVRKALALVLAIAATVFLAREGDPSRRGAHG
jgi:transporter family protein